jgi:hypothetical protein
LGAKNNDSLAEKWVIVKFSLWNIESAAIPINKTIPAYAWVHPPF